jgi:hypothetical protein
MSTFRQHTRRIEIDAPDAPAAFALEKRLAHLRPTAIGAGLGWTVELEDGDDRVEEVEAAIRYWLRTIGLPATVMRVDGVARTVSTHAYEGDGTVTLPDYDGRVLTHEP